MSRPPRPLGRPRPGWPKVLPCLRCGRARVATGPGDRFHASCRAIVWEAAAALPDVTLLAP